MLHDAIVCCFPVILAYSGQYVLSMSVSFDVHTAAIEVIFGCGLVKGRQMPKSNTLCKTKSVIEHLKI